MVIIKRLISFLIIATLTTTVSYSNTQASGEEVLSESMGLMMLHYVYTKNESAFENLRLFCEQKLKNGSIYVYREGFWVNALIDDFRLIEALLLAGETFNNSYYTDGALAYANILYEINISNGFLVDLYDVQYKINDISSEIFGCFGNAETKETYWFNQLTALLAYDAGAFLVRTQ